MLGIITLTGDELPVPVVTPSVHIHKHFVCCPQRSIDSSEGEFPGNDRQACYALYASGPSCFVCETLVAGCGVHETVLFQASALCEQ